MIDRLNTHLPFCSGLSAMAALILLCGVLGGGVQTLAAGDATSPSQPAAGTTAPPATAPTAPPAPAAAKETGPDVLPTGDDVTASTYRDLPKPFISKEIGSNKPMTVWYDSKKRRVFIEGKFCLSEGGLEFLAVANGGKTHESLLELNCRPQDVLYAMLVCTYENNNNLQGEGDSIVPAGDPVDIYVEFKGKDGKTVRHRIEDYAYNVLTKKHMMKISYAFTGSSYTKDPDSGRQVYLADLEKDMVTCFRTAWSVFNTPLEEGNNDTVYVVNKANVPPLNTPCVMIITRGSPIDKNQLDDSPAGQTPGPDGNQGKYAQENASGVTDLAMKNFKPQDPKSLPVPTAVSDPNP
ncbi:MAG: YdjY domain-containing protein [Planctomycetota bacterium]